MSSFWHGDSANLGIGGTANAKAHDLYLRARQLVRKELEAEERTAAELFREATREDPKFALAFAGLADVLVQIARWKLTDWKEAEREAIAAAAQAVALAPGLAEHIWHRVKRFVCAMMAMPAPPISWRSSSAPRTPTPITDLRASSSSRAKRPRRLRIMNAPSRSHLMITATSFSRFRNIRRFATWTASGSCLERASNAIERHLQLNPEDVRAYGHGAGVLALLGNSDDATRYIAKALAFRPDDHGNLATLACAAALMATPNKHSTCSNAPSAPAAATANGFSLTMI